MAERPPQLDETDLAILRELQTDGRMANVELAARVGLSASATLERVRRLEREGVIEGYVARVDPAALGRHVTVFVAVSLKDHNREAVRNFEEAVGRVGEVLECHHVAGEADFLLKLLVHDVAALRDVLVEQISQIPNVGRVHSTLVLSTSKHSLSVPLQEPGRRPPPGGTRKTGAPT
jgi:Lrp/AsnC family leucine-responsive transcriptional regulator